MDELKVLKSAIHCRNGACSECDYNKGDDDCTERLFEDVLKLKKRYGLYEWVDAKKRLPMLEEVDKEGNEIRWAKGKFVVCDRRGQVFPANYESVIIRGRRERRWRWPWGNLCGNDIIAWAELPAPPEWFKKEGGQDD